MNLAELKEAVEKTLVEEYGLNWLNSGAKGQHESSLEYAMLMLNGGAELPFRTRLMAKIQNKIQNERFAVTEWVTKDNLEKKEKRADIAILDRSDSKKIPSSVIELKSNFLSQAGQVKGRFFKDVEKWVFPDCKVGSKLFLYWVTDVTRLDHDDFLKGYVSVTPKADQKSDVIQNALSEVAALYGLKSEPPINCFVETSYPFPKTEFNTRFYFYGTD